MNRIVAGFFLVVALGSGASTSTFAADEMQGSAMHGSMMKPHCSSGDPVVMVNTKNKTYTMADKSHMQMNSSTRGSSMHNSSMHNGSMDHNMMMKDHMSMMCKSKADAMGAHMMSGAMQGHM